jgi:hypothetical protein
LETKIINNSTYINKIKKKKTMSIIEDYESCIIAGGGWGGGGIGSISRSAASYIYMFYII